MDILYIKICNRLSRSHQVKDVQIMADHTCPTVDLSLRARLILHLALVGVTVASAETRGNS